MSMQSYFLLRSHELSSLWGQNSRGTPNNVCVTFVTPAIISDQVYCRSRLIRNAKGRKAEQHSRGFFMSSRNSQPAHIFSLLVATTLTLSPAPTASLGVGDGLLDNCQPPRVTCVSSQDDTPASFLEPWEYEEDLAELQSRLIKAVLEEPRATVVAQQPRYLRFEIPTANPNLVDDLEFFFPPLDNVVHFRSARRDRSFDFLLNRRRLERLRQKMHLVQIPVLRNRMSVLNIFETPLDSFGPSAVDVDAIIDNRGVGSRSVR